MLAHCRGNCDILGQGFLLAHSHIRCSTTPGLPQHPDCGLGRGALCGRTESLPHPARPMPPAQAGSWPQWGLPQRKAFGPSPEQLGLVEGGDLGWGPSWGAGGEDSKKKCRVQIILRYPWVDTSVQPPSPGTSGVTRLRAARIRHIGQKRRLRIWFPPKGWGWALPAKHSGSKQGLGQRGPPTQLYQGALRQGAGEASPPFKPAAPPPPLSPPHLPPGGGLQSLLSLPTCGPPTEGSAGLADGRWGLCDSQAQRTSRTRAGRGQQLQFQTETGGH